MPGGQPSSLPLVGQEPLAEALAQGPLPEAQLPQV